LFGAREEQGEFGGQPEIVERPGRERRVPAFGRGLRVAEEDERHALLIARDVARQFVRADAFEIRVGDDDVRARLAQSDDGRRPARHADDGQSGAHQRIERSGAARLVGHDEHASLLA
jgi:hypothetical protein